MAVGYIKKRSLSLIVRRVGLVKYGRVHYNGVGFGKWNFLAVGRIHSIEDTVGDPTGG